MSESGKSEIGLLKQLPASRRRQAREWEKYLSLSLSRRVGAEKDTFLNCGNPGKSEIFLPEFREEALWLLAQAIKSFGC